MSGPSGASVAELLPEAQLDGYAVLTLSLDEPGRAGLSGAALATRGPLRGLFDGYLFDREDLARSLDLPPSTSSDADLVLGAYERWGENALSRLRGSFLAAVVDPVRDVAIVARDPLGSHPVFFTRVGSAVMFATWPALLLAQRGVSRELNRAALADHLASRWPDREETFFKAISRVPPGWRAVVTRGRFQLQRYWDPVPDEDKPIEWLTDEETRRFSDVLDRAVTRCLSQGRAAIFLSGGFDSVSIAAVAADRARQAGLEPPLALSLGFPDPTCDEQVVQRGVAKTLGLPFKMVDFREAAGPRGLLAAGLELSRGLSSPLFNTWSPAYLELLRRARPDGVRTILTGSGGDEWLGVSPFLAADLMRRGDLPGLLRFVRMWHRSYTHSWWQASRGTFWTFGVRPLLGRALYGLAPQTWNRSRVWRSLRSDPSWVAPGSELRDELRRRAAASLVSAAPSGGFYARESRASLDDVLTSRDHEEQYEFGQRLGIRYMHPYWDADLATQIYRTRPELLLQGGKAKGLVRETVARRFPELGFERQRKVSAASFFTSMLKAEAPALWREVGACTALDELGVVDGNRVKAFADEAFRKQDRDMSKVLHLMALEVWVRAHRN